MAQVETSESDASKDVSTLGAELTLLGIDYVNRPQYEVLHMALGTVVQRNAVFFTFDFGRVLKDYWSNDNVVVPSTKFVLPITKPKLFEVQKIVRLYQQSLRNEYESFVKFAKQWHEVMQHHEDIRRSYHESVLQVSLGNAFAMAAPTFVDPNDLLDIPSLLLKITTSSIRETNYVYIGAIHCLEDVVEFRLEGLTPFVPACNHYLNVFALRSFLSTWHYSLMSRRRHAKLASVAFKCAFELASIGDPLPPYASCLFIASTLPSRAMRRLLMSKCRESLEIPEDVLDLLLASDNDVKEPVADEEEAASMVPTASEEQSLPPPC